MKRRKFIKSIPLAIFTASCAPKRAVTSLITPDSQQPDPEPKVDLETQRQAYLKKIRSGILDRTITPVEHLVIDTALTDFPKIKQLVNERITESRGRIVDIINHTDGRELLSELIASDEELNRLLDKAPGLIKTGMDRLLAVSPVVNSATPEVCEANYEELLQVLKEDLQVWAKGISERLMDINIDEVQAHVDQYESSDNEYRNDMAIHYLPFPNPLEGFQALFHNVFDLYLQLAHGNKANVVFSKDTEDSQETLNDLFLDPEIKRLALVGHGSWDSLGLSGTHAEPSDMVAKFLLAYKMDPDKIMGDIEKMAEHLKDLDKGGRNSMMMIISDEDPSKRTMDVNKLQKAFNAMKKLTHSIANWKGGIYFNSFLRQLFHKNQISKRDPQAQKEVYRYTCGTGRYNWPTEKVRVGIKVHYLREKARDLFDKLSIQKGIFADDLFSAAKHDLVGKYEEEFTHTWAELERQRRIDRLNMQIQGCETGKYHCPSDSKKKADRMTVAAKCKQEIAELMSMPIGEFNPTIKENEAFGTNLTSDTRGYEGVNYLPQYIADPLIENLGGLENFELDTEN